MNRRFELTDRAVEEMLRRRAGRAWPEGLREAIATEVAPMRQALAIRSALRWPATPLARMAWLVLIAALLTALAAGALLVGGARPRAIWERLELPGFGAFTDVADGPGGHVAVGLVDTGREMWSSSDCRHWAPTGIDATAVTAGGPGYVAAGPTGEVWGSADGRTWSHLGDIPLAGAANAAVIDVAARPGRIVAVGTTEGIQAIWTSPDGAVWTRVDPLEAAGFGFPYGSGQMNAVAASADGFVAVGQQWDSVPIWTSADGVHWAHTGPSIYPGLSGPPWVTIRSILPAPEGGWIAFGSWGAGGVVVSWTSRDSVTWTSRQESGLVFVNPPAVARAGTGFVAALTDDSVRAAPSPPAGDLVYPLHHGRPFTSVDGVTWKPLAGPTIDLSQFDAVFACGSDLLVSDAGSGMRPHGIHDTVIPTVWRLAGGAEAHLP